MWTAVQEDEFSKEVFFQEEFQRLANQIDLHQQLVHSIDIRQPSVHYFWVLVNGVQSDELTNDKDHCYVEANYAMVKEGGEKTTLSSHGSLFIVDRHLHVYQTEVQNFIM